MDVARKIALNQQAAAQAAELARLPAFVQQLRTTFTDPQKMLDANLPIETAELLAQQEVAGHSRKGQLNIYTCDACRGHMVTRDIETGVTPFTTPCTATEGCHGLMRSSMYQVFDQAMRATHVWYRPIVTDLIKPHLVGHLNKGGLLLRPAKPEEDV